MCECHGCAFEFGFISHLTNEKNKMFRSEAFAEADRNAYK